MKVEDFNGSLPGKRAPASKLDPWKPKIDEWLAELFAREVLRFLVDNELLSPEWTERIRTFRHTGFNVPSRVRAKTKTKAERVGKYMIRPLLSLERLSLDEKQEKVCYRYEKQANDVERMDCPEFIAGVTSHIPDKGQFSVRYYALYANAHREKEYGEARAMLRTRGSCSPQVKKPLRRCGPGRSRPLRRRERGYPL